MKLLHYLLSLALSACGTASSDEPTGCQTDADCKSNRICLEGICQEQEKDATVFIIERDANGIQNNFGEGNIYFTFRKKDEPERLRTRHMGIYHLNQHLIPLEEIDFTPPQGKYFGTLTILSNGKYIGLTLEKEDEVRTTHIFMPRIGELISITENINTIPSLSWMDYADQSLIYKTRNFNGETRLREDIIWRVNISESQRNGLTVEEPVKLHTMPENEYGTRLAAMPRGFMIAYTCQSLENPSITEICTMTRDGINKRQITHTTHSRGGLFTSNSGIIWTKNEDYIIYDLCREDQRNAICETTLEGDRRVAIYTEVRRVPIFNDEDTKAVIGEYIWDRQATNDKEKPVMYNLEPLLRRDKIEDFTPFGWINN